MIGFQVVMQTVIHLSLVATSLGGAIPQKRIVNGKQAVDLSHPYMASVQVCIHDQWHHVCGGALIAKNKVLTAAHCIYGKSSADIRITVGETDLYAPPNNYGQDQKASSYTVHEGYAVNDNDLAIIYLERPVVLNHGVQLATLALKDTSFANTKCVMLGFGQMGYHSLAANLMQAEILAITTSGCKERFSGLSVSVNAKNICVLDRSGVGYRSSACMGDSGGPLMCGKNFQYLAGISSWGMKACDGNYPGVYIRVSEYLDWIASH